MNEGILVVVCGYAGDAHQVKFLMPMHKKHQCPILILSPEDSPITPEMIGDYSDVSFKTGGRRAYIGELSLAREKKHLELMLESQYSFFLAHDADSVCMIPEIPKELYRSDGFFWAGIVGDEIHARSAEYKWPRLAFHPPYFFSRSVAQRMIKVWDSIPADPQTPYIDNHIMKVVCAAGINYKNLVISVRDLFAENALGRIPFIEKDGSFHEHRNDGGRVFYHPIKEEAVLRRRVEDLELFKKEFQKEKI